MSSDSDLPISERLKVVSKAAAMSREGTTSREGSPVPAWIAQATPIKHQVAPSGLCNRGLLNASASGEICFLVGLLHSQQ